MKIRRSLLLLVAGVLFWMAGVGLIVFTEPLALRIVGLILFVCGPALVFIAGRLARSNQ